MARTSRFPLMAPEDGSELSRVDWTAIALRLLTYATWKARNLRWRTGEPWDLAAGKTPEDIVAEAMLKVIDGTRSWHPARGPLLPFLQSVVDSLMSHLVESADNRIQMRLLLLDDVDQEDRDRAPHRAIRADDPVAHADEADPRERIDHLRATLRARGHQELVDVVNAIATGCDPTPQALAAQLQTTVSVINNRLKRLRRIAQRIMSGTGLAVRGQCRASERGDDA